MSDLHTVHPKQSVYGRRKGRPLHKRKAKLVAELLPSLTLALKEERVDPATLFDGPMHDLWLEIGFGGGEHLAVQARRHPHIGFIGCEPFLNGVAGLLDHIDRHQLKNIRIYPDDARRVLTGLPQASVGRCYILYADPWPKLRHAERRFVGRENIPRLARILQPGADLCLATDDSQLAGWMHDHMRAAEDFTEIYATHTPPENWVSTRYEEKGIKAGRKPTYFCYRRKN